MKKTTKANAKTSKKAIGYCRVSTLEQAQEGVSLAAQEERVRAYAAMRGLELVEVVREEGVSGGTPFASRPQGARVMRAVEDGTVNAIIVVKLDRGFRDACDCLSITKSWDERGAALCIVDMGGMALDTCSAMGRMFLTLVAAFAELERNLIGERTSAALQHLSDHGLKLGAPALGWERTEETDADGHKVVREVPDELATVERIRALAGEGRTLRDIAATLAAERRATKRGGAWHPEAVRRVLARLGAA